ncbi:hypothetical protein N0V93_008871 [Gnomoniopsis smithogilvyi]|uniref:NADP-dependent oxidoreductase domain-containing protein n=1 Tax=Gnomoniopsis smithogilvyi TaxID=1191159 RepID=A0A9W8YIL1_9PEZI|nr:hypothetical protein N0V93_008871 [Gnomoniopsis smithogilvyi]
MSEATSVPSMLEIGGYTVPRLCFGLGSLMKWAPGHTHPIPTDSSAEVKAAIDAGFRHFDCGDLYTNTPSTALALRDAKIPRKDLFISLKLNTYNKMKPANREDIIENTKKFIEDFRLEGYVDVALLHFPPRGKNDNLTNREAWGVLEHLKDLGLARIIGVSNWTLDDYKDQFAAGDLKYKPQINEYEVNPHLVLSPSFKERLAFEKEHGIVPKHYGVLTPVTGRLSMRSGSPKLVSVLDELSQETSLSPHEILLRWAWENLESILVTSTSKPQRAKSLTKLLASGNVKLERSVYDRLEAAASEDGFEGKQFYLHAHMDK